MPNIFGPVPSRRLGLSLGVDLIPGKTCTYDCLYCQVGQTTYKITEPKSYTPVQDIVDELKQCLDNTQPDTITLAGTGEPTLDVQLGQVISGIKKITAIPVAILTNGALLWREDVRERVADADIIMPTMTTVFENTFRAIHRPHEKLELLMIINGMKELRSSFQGRIHMEVVFLAGINDTSHEIEGLRAILHEISPDKIQINTVVRPPSDSKAKALDMGQLEDIKVFFGDKAEIIAHVPLKQGKGPASSPSETLLEMAKRRPVRVIDIAHILNKSPEEIERLLKGLLIKGAIQRQEHGGEWFFMTVKNRP
ncbi:MAG: radical SAM protein [Deltaproteobacteria bacterium]|nr:radical SAM protein [Deltaproteobacteria bacterium]